nr:capsid protein [Phytophthora castaneae RNA virus 3]
MQDLVEDRLRAQMEAGLAPPTATTTPPPQNTDAVRSAGSPETATSLFPGAAIQVHGALDFYTRNVPEITLSAEELDSSPFVQSVLSQDRLDAIGAADTLMAASGGGMVSPFRFQTRLLAHSGGISGDTARVVPTLHAPRDAPWLWRYRSIVGDNTAPTVLMDRMSAASAAERGGFDAGYSRFRKLDAEGLLAMVPGALVQLHEHWLSWNFEMRMGLAYYERSSAEDAALRAGPVVFTPASPVTPPPSVEGGSDEGVSGSEDEEDEDAARSSPPKSKGPERPKGTDCGFFGSSVGSMSVFEKGSFLHTEVASLTRGRDTVECPPVKEGGFAVVSRESIGSWYDAYLAGEISSEVFVSRGRTFADVASDLGAIWCDRSRSGTLEKSEGRIWVLAPHLLRPNGGAAWRGNVMFLHPNRLYSWDVAAQLCGDLGAHGRPIGGTKRDYLALSRYLATVRAGGTLPDRVPGKHGHSEWQCHLPRSHVVVRLAAATDLLVDRWCADSHYLQGGGALSHTLFFEAVRIGRGFDKVWQRLCGSPATLSGWGARGATTYSMGVALVNALYASSGSVPLGLVFSSGGLVDRGSPKLSSVRVVSRSQWGSFGWPIEVPSEWKGLRESGAAPIPQDARRHWKVSPNDYEDVRWASLLTTESGGHITTLVSVPDLPEQVVKIKLYGMSGARGGDYESVDLPLELLLAVGTALRSVVRPDFYRGERTLAGVWVSGGGGSPLSGGISRSTGVYF